MYKDLTEVNVAQIPVKLFHAAYTFFAYIFPLQLPEVLNNVVSLRQQCTCEHVYARFFFSHFLSKYKFVYMPSYMFISLCPRCVCAEAYLLVIKRR